MRTRHSWLLKPQDAGGTILEDLDQPVEDGRPALLTRCSQVRADSRAARGVASRETKLQLASCLWVSQMFTRRLMVAPLDHVITVVRRPESSAEAVSESIEVPAEVTPRTIDRLTDDSPEVLQRPDLGAVQHIYRRHSPQDPRAEVALSRQIFGWFSFSSVPLPSLRSLVSG